ncbi:hypothetical protein KAS41_04405 [Candidatus Parcubacteria bacterium]|nr:hypothetical protein [Candidatus Parcubacteria bacterium]
MEKINYKKRMEKIGKRTAKNKTGNAEKNNFKCRTINEKLCPFMSDGYCEVACSPRCKFYRADKKNYECYFMVLQSISWFLKKKNEEQKEN